MRGIDNLSSGNGGSSTLAGLSDVSVATPSNGQVLKYNSTSNKWENSDESGGVSGIRLFEALTYEEVKTSGSPTADVIINNNILTSTSSSMSNSETNILSTDTLDLTGIDVIKITLHSGTFYSGGAWNGFFYVCDDDTDIREDTYPSVSDKIVFDNTATDVVYLFDVSQLTGDWYVGVCTGGHTNLVVEAVTVGSGGGGHTIINSAGVDMTQRKGLQFTGGVQVVDDSQNDKTIVSVAGLDVVNRRFPKISTTSCKPVCNVERYKWESDTDFLNGIGSVLSYIDGRYFWTDGENIYIDSDNYSIHYKLPKDSNVWVSNSWNKSYIDGTRIWTDGDDIYCSYGSYQYVLNKSNHTWEDMQWDNVDTQYLMGSYIWSDGDDIYLNNHSYSYFRKLVKGTNDWTTVAWVNGDLDSQYIWTDGDNIYYSWYYLSTGTNYILDKSTKTWSATTFGNYNLINGLDVWSDGKNIFASDSNGNYKFNKNTKSWYAVDFEGTLANIHITGRDVFTDGYNIYLSMWSNPNHYFAKFKVYKNNIKGAPVVNANVELPIAESEAV